MISAARSSNVELNETLFHDCQFDVKILAKILYRKYKEQKKIPLNMKMRSRKFYLLCQKRLFHWKKRDGFTANSLIHIMKTDADQMELLRKIFRILNDFTKTKVEDIEKNSEVEQKRRLPFFEESCSESRLNSARISYNKKAKEYYSYIKTLLHNRQSVLFSKIYTRMFLADSENRFIKTNDINKIEKQYGKKILLTGAAGIGKSLMLRYMLIKVLKNHEQIPVLLFLRNLVYNKDSLKNHDYLCKQIYDHMKTLDFDVTLESFKASLFTLNYVILLDGFDEVEYESRKTLEYLIIEFCKKYPHIIVVVSSRPESSFVSWNGFCELEIRPLLGLNREVAKAMIIDAARGWNESPTPEEVALYGHGIVPIKISDIIQTKDDEIKFVVTDISEKWNTYNYYFPVPLKDNHYPYYARATMCYFPICDRAQGVDYTNTELNLHFGRLKDSGSLKEINEDKQNDTMESEGRFILEGEARKRFRKWDNVKYVSEKPKNIKRPKASYSNKNWAMEVKTSNRLDPKDGVGLRFGVVITLKEMYGVNIIDEFIRNCNLNGWLVNKIDITNRIDIHEKVNEEIDFK